MLNYIKRTVMILLPCLGFYLAMLWVVGGHGRFLFRPHMIEDCIFMGIEFICFGIPLFLFLKSKKKG